MINWKVRLKNPTFWMTFVPAVILLVQNIATLLGFQLDLSGISAQLEQIIQTIFILLAAVGVVTDHTTTGVGDSQRALTYDKPQ